MLPVLEAVVPLPASRFPLSALVVGPAAPLVVFDMLAACADDPLVLPFAADADFVPLPLQATAAVAIAIEKRIDRFIFRG